MFRPATRACRRELLFVARLCALLVALPALVFVPDAAAQAFTFALIGDGPYGASAVARFDRMLDEINADPEVAFVLHAGDIKSGSESCGDALLRARFDQLQRLRVPLVYTPGDNEWADCHVTASGRFHPLERLSALRRLFFPDPRRTTGGTTMAVATQADDPHYSEFVENVRFVRSGVVFATLHAIGSSNDLDPWRIGNDSRRRPRPERIAEFQRREDANLAWLDAAFDHAGHSNARAVVLLMQANPRFESLPGSSERVPFEALVTRLQHRAAAFRRPVLLLHGDFHVYLVDYPLDRDELTPRVPNLMRVQSFGAPLVGWVRVRVDPSDIKVFRVIAR
jgi:hypothetical protein